MESVKEITVFLENLPGTLARLAAGLAEKGINILGFYLTNALDHGALRLIVDDPTSTVHLLEERNMLVLEHDVLAVQLKNQAGALEALARAMSDGGVNIEDAYGSAGTASGVPTTLYLRVSDLPRAEGILQGVDGVS